MTTQHGVCAIFIFINKEGMGISKKGDGGHEGVLLVGCCKEGGVTIIEESSLVHSTFQQRGNKEPRKALGQLEKNLFVFLSVQSSVPLAKDE